MKYRFKPYTPSHIRRGHLNMGENINGIDTFEVNSLYFERNGKPWIPTMGEYHFNRDHCDRWYEELCKMRAGGITTVSTYLFWNYHEEEEGSFCFDGDLDIHRFLKDAERAGLEAVLRLGPWVHGEARYGGFPDWLMEKGIPLRQNHPEYLALVKRYWQQIYAQVEDCLYKNGGNVIAIQFENELTDQPDHLLTLKKMALEIGFHAPIYTVTGWNRANGAEIPIQDVIPVFSGYAEAPWEQHREKLPPSSHYFFNKMRNDTAVGADLMTVFEEGDWQLPYELYPFVTCELGGGIQVTHHRRPIIQAMDIYALALVTLGSGNNLPGYYMYHGGSNKIGQNTTLNETTESGYPNDCSTISYDFQAPISEYGEIRDSYRLLNLLNLFATDFAGQLSVMEAVEAVNAVERTDTTSLRYMMRCDGYSGFIFINHYQRLEHLRNLKDVCIEACGVEFPAMDICGEISFFLPFRMKLGQSLLRYATAQPICREGNRYYFLEIPGIAAKYEFEGPRDEKIEIITLSLEEAMYLRKLDGKVWITPGYDSYQEQGNICRQPDLNWMKKHGKKVRPCSYEKIPCQPAFELQYDYELQLGGPRALRWYEIILSPNAVENDVYQDTFIEISDLCDVAQLYVDGILVADQFFYGKPWRIPASLISGGKCHLVMSEFHDDFYREFSPVHFSK